MTKKILIEYEIKVNDCFPYLSVKNQNNFSSGQTLFLNPSNRNFEFNLSSKCLYIYKYIYYTNVDKEIGRKIEGSVQQRKKRRSQLALENEIFDVNATLKPILTALCGHVGYYIKFSIVPEPKIDLNLHEKYLKFPHFQFKYNYRRNMFERDIDFSISKLYIYIYI